jgi:lipoprotein-anchoring transpeptidase ErfK/SrfK
MRAILIALATAAVLAAAPAKASTIVARVDISEQRMQVFVNGWPTYSWPVSTARRGYVTPVGSYHAQRLAEMWYSRKYDNSPMPHSIFFKGGYAIHGTGYVKNLGKPASHGCVRLHPDNATTLFSLVKDNGMENMQVEVVQ